MWGYGHGWGMMDGWGGGGMGPFGLIIWILLLALAVAAVIWLVRAAARPGGAPPGTERRSSGLDVLEERYARGEISREEYVQKKRDILG